MMLFRFRYLLFFTLLAFTLKPGLSDGQTGLVDPYSRYGIGDFNNQPGIQGFSMGNTGNALRNDSTTPFTINLKNPAACFYNRITTIDASVLYTNTGLSSQGQQQNASNTYFGYFAIAFPVGKIAGMDMGIVPMSTVGYDITTNSNLDSIGPTGNSTNIGTLTNEYSGAGGVNRVFLGLAISPIKNLSLGIHASYLFGNITNVQTITYPLNYSAYNGERLQNVEVHDFYFNYGLMYSIGKESGWHGTIGLTASLASNVSANYSLLTENYIVNPGLGIIYYDTLQDSNKAGKIRLPMTYGAGITIKKGDKWTFTFDYNVQNWSQFSLFGVQQTLSNSTQMGLGVEYVPHKNSEIPHTYLQRISYRFGLSSSQSYLDINNTPLHDYAVSFGLGIPVGANRVLDRVSTLNVGIQLGQLGTTTNNLVQQDYFKFQVALTFNDRWFKKRLYE
ncbi:MAG TPA: hypothetical protein VNZ45_06215 [Bacteroidia bacterium]|jgi:hypothetical protein|nr:hypothetical protein [Bacteroidia bacterium]